MKVLVLGSSPRVNSIIWKLCQSQKHPIEVLLAPGDREMLEALGASGTEKTVECLDINIYDTERLVEVALVRNVDLTIPCEPELYELGIVDKFKEAGLLIFGPKRDAARIEWSNFYARELMYEYGIPCPRYASFDNEIMALAYLQVVETPFIIRAENPFSFSPAEKVIHEKTEAEEYIKGLFKQRNIATSARRVLIEEVIDAPRFNISVICDGEIALSLPPVQIYRDEKLNEEGAYAPVPSITDDVLFAIRQQIINPSLMALAENSCSYTGLLSFEVAVSGLEKIKAKDPNEIPEASEDADLEQPIKEKPYYDLEPSPAEKALDETKDLEIKLIAFHSCLANSDAHVIMPIFDEDLFDVLSASARSNLSYFKDGFHRLAASALNVNLLNKETEFLAEPVSPELINEKVAETTKEMSASLKAAALVFRGRSNSATETHLETATESNLDKGTKVLSSTAIASSLLDAQILAYKVAENISSSHQYFKANIGDQGMV